MRKFGFYFLIFFAAIFFFAAWGNSQPPAVASSTHVKTETLNCRQLPDINSVLIHSFAKNEKLEILETKENWQRVSFGTNACWVKSEFTYSKQEPVTSVEASKEYVKQEIIIGFFLSVFAFLIRPNKNIPTPNSQKKKNVWEQINLKSIENNQNSEQSKNLSVDDKLKAIHSLGVKINLSSGDFDKSRYIIQIKKLLEEVWAEHPFVGLDVDEANLESLTVSINELESAIFRRSKTDESLFEDKKMPELSVATNFRNNSSNYSLPQSNSKKKCRWLTPMEEVYIKGVKIDCGMVYVGTATGYNREDNCIIDANLPVSNHADKSGTQMGYWPSYSGIRPTERRAYLNWLAGGRNDKEVGIGYVFLFFYGLERRAFIDKSFEEYGALFSEVERLKNIYSGNNSFKRYAENFINYLKLHLNKIEKPKILQEMRYGYDMPISTMVYLGNRIKSNKSIDADDGLIWLLSSPLIYLRTPANRCFEEFKTLWKIRFDEKYPSGMKVIIPKRKLKLNYSSACGFYSEIGNELGDFPDISGLNSPVEKLRNLANSCTDELDAYSRYLGRNTENINKVIAASYLPAILLSDNSTQLTRPLINHLNSLFTNAESHSSFKRLIVSDMLNLLNLEDERQQEKSSIEALSNIAEKLGYGLEPDVRFGAFTQKKDENIILFKVDGKSNVVVNSPFFVFYRSLIEISALASASDGKMLQIEFENLRAQIQEDDNLNINEKIRLEAFATSLWENKNVQQGALRRLAKLSASEKQLACNTAINAILADGYIDPKEVKFLEKLYKAFSIPIEDIYSALHRGKPNDEILITVQQVSIEVGTPVPVKPNRKGIELDINRLKRIKAETADVSTLLSDIFSEEDETSEVDLSKEQKTHQGAYKGLDMAHSELLNMLISRKSISRKEYSDAAKSLNLLPDGAAETINEWSFDLLDESMIELEENMVISEEHIEIIRGEFG